MTDKSLCKILHNCKKTRMLITRKTGAVEGMATKEVRGEREGKKTQKE